ncbi:MAG TPA: hypothetical protein VEK36_00680 [Candidatus Paceibacterota bacterium]|nr:hypothetical protein [Candidatus Paceibacterota bacterium]
MALIRRQSNLISYLIIALGLVGGYVFQSQFIAPPSPPVLPAAGKEIQELKKLKIDFKALENEQYRSLQVYGELPVNPGLSGKRDLFAPF